METDLKHIFYRILIILLLILLNGFFNACQMALVSVRKTRIRQLLEDGDNRALGVQRLIESPSEFMATMQIGLTTALLLAAAFAAVGLTQYPEKWLLQAGFTSNVAYILAVIVVTFCVGVLAIVVGDTAAKSLGVQFAEGIALRTSGLIQTLTYIGLPVVKLVTLFSSFVARPFGVKVSYSSPIVTEEELKMLVEAGEEEGVIEVEEKEMIHSIFDFTDTIVKQVMVPRTDMNCAPVNATLPDLLDVITKSGHSRIPIYGENVDNILGVVHVKDLLTCLINNQIEIFDVRTAMREAYFIPGSKDVDELLAEFQRHNIQLAIVRDEYGGTAGLVTVEDLLEEIVGEIHDEYDVKEEPMLVNTQPDEYLVNARMHIEDLNEELGTDFPEDEDFDTIGGFVFDLFGHQPAEGDFIRYKELELTIDAMESGRIQRISMRTTAPITEAEEKRDIKS